MNFARFILAGSALAWAGFGLLFFVSPENLDGVGLVVDNAVARAEVRAFYGGLELGIAAKTAENHVRNILGKLHLSRRSDLVRYAVEHGLD